MPVLVKGSSIGDTFIEAQQTFNLISDWRYNWRAVINTDVTEANLKLCQSILSLDTTI